MPKKKPIFEDYILCIGCGQRSKGKYFSYKNDPKEVAELQKARDAIFEELGWRKVPGGWKCNNCTGIRGRTACY